jgi:hypothetical protein
MLRGRKAQTKTVQPRLEPCRNAIVLIDQEPLRDQAAADCSAAMARLKRARASWHEFERKDKPAFVRWRAREFGALLSAARETEMHIRDLQTLVHEVEMEMRRGFHDVYRAYELVMSRRSNPAGAGLEDDTSRKPTGRARPLSDFEKEALFQEWVKRSLGTHPDKMDDEAYSSSFEAFKRHMFRPVAEETPRPRNNNRPPRKRRTIEQENENEEERDRVDTRVKALYRRLVRRLHPDLRADGSAAVSALWHEVQEAYAASDIARMEILLALSDIETNRTRDQSLSQMRSILRELERSFRALEKSLLEAEGEEAWDFARLGPSSQLRLRVERQLKCDLAARTQRLDLLSRTVAEWAAGPGANRKVPVILA